MPAPPHPTILHDQTICGILVNMIFIIKLGGSQLHHLAPDSDQAVRDTKGRLMRILGALFGVDGSSAITDFMAESLRDEGYIVAVAHDRTGTLASVDHQMPALVLLDDTIVGLSASLLRAYSTHRHHVRVPIITTTTNLVVAAAMTACDWWACLAKPFSIDALVAYVMHHVPHTRRAPVGPAISYV
jgi:CheY-like chemotaxis protein